MVRPLATELSCILLLSMVLEMLLQLDWSPAVLTFHYTEIGKVYICLYKVSLSVVFVRGKSKQ